jgi:hypothetical protein
LKTSCAFPPIAVSARVSLNETVSTVVLFRSGAEIDVSR